MKFERNIKIDEGDSIIYFDLGDHIAIVPVSKNPLKDLKNLKITSKQTISEIRKEARQTARRLVGKILKGD